VKRVLRRIVRMPRLETGVSLRGITVGTAMVLACLMGGQAGAQGGSAAPALPVRAAPVAESGPPWAALTVAQQQALAPLKTEWSAIDSARKEKWLDVATRMSSMSDTDRARIQQRMSAWVRMSPAERGRTRIQFQEAREVAPVNRAQQWQAYQALPADERRALAEKASVAKKSPVAPPTARPATAAPRGSGAAPLTAEVKRNVVPFLPAPAGTAPKHVAPAVVQSRPGATTSLVTTRARPPVHQQAGLPKVNASAGFVDPTTLLPRRGPQGAAVVSTRPASSNAR
jgi:hypothetical protein